MRPTRSRADSSRVRRVPAAALVVVLAALGALGSAAPAGHAASSTDELPEVPVVTAEAADRQAALVAAEDRRLTEIRTIAALSRWQGKNWKTPYRLESGSGYTLVLTPSSIPYTLADLQRLAPQTLLRMSDGSYLLTENIAVAARATLHLAAPGGLTLRLASSGDGFTSLVSLGGRLELAGEPNAAVTITSWDVDRGTEDTRTVDGRAYVRAIGGQFEAEHVKFSHLGFWSGRTGGLSLTDRPNTGAIESIGSDESLGGIPSLLNGISLSPAGPLQEGQAPTLRYAVPAVDYVSSRIAHVTIDKNAFGLFVSGANGVQITESTIRNSRIAGLVLHRFVRNGVITKTVSEHNVGDGFALERATTGITISESTARYNTGSGFSISGRPLADGPSASGTSLRPYGNSSIANSVATGNGHYGIRVTGGINMGLQNNRVSGSEMGILVIGPARRVSVTGNHVADAATHGIALVTGVRGATVTGNVIDNVSTGVYLRDSAAEVKGNTVQRAAAHGVSIVGRTSTTSVEYNVLSGTGASALDAHRTDNEIAVLGNQTSGWHDTTPWYFVFKKLLQPMTALWTLIIALVGLSAIRGRGRNREVVHPYQHTQIDLREHILPHQTDGELTAAVAPRGRHAVVSE
jgi:hypothetical protein